MGSFMMMGIGAGLTFLPIKGKKPSLVRKGLGVATFVLALAIYMLGAYVRGVNSGAF